MLKNNYCFRLVFFFGGFFFLQILLGSNWKWDGVECVWSGKRERESGEEAGDRKIDACFMSELLNELNDVMTLAVYDVKIPEYIISMHTMQNIHIYTLTRTICMYVHIIRIRKRQQQQLKCIWWFQQLTDLLSICWICFSLHSFVCLKSFGWLKKNAFHACLFSYLVYFDGV